MDIILEYNLKQRHIRDESRIDGSVLHVNATIGDKLHHNSDVYTRDGICVRLSDGITAGNTVRIFGHRKDRNRVRFGQLVVRNRHTYCAPITNW